MNRKAVLAFGFVFALSNLIATVHAEEKPKGFEAFAMVRTRNIFDPTRRAMHVDAPKEKTVVSRRPNAFTLTGTMVSAGKSLAFFTGTRSEYSKVITVGDSMANYKIAAITPVQVELEHEGKRQVLAVGRQMQLEGSTGDGAEGETTPAEVPALAPGPETAPAVNAPPPMAAPINDKAEILRRMMEKRQKEMSK